MENLNKIKAFLELEDLRTEIGELVQSDEKVYFKFHPEFVVRGLEISPFKLKLSRDILTATQTYDGLFGVFSDSLPDGWGRLLLDRKLAGAGMDPQNISPLTRLAYLGTNSMGAITYQPCIDNNEEAEIPDLDVISDAVEMVIKGDSETVIDALFVLGGSSGGARPKILVGFNPQSQEIMSGRDVLPEGFEHWIIKLRSSSDPSDIAQIEYVYNQMAKLAGIEVTDFRLFKSRKGYYFFGTKRFDRIGNKKLHLHSVAGLLHDNFRMSAIDYGHIMECAYNLEQNFEAYSKIFRLAAFNVFSHNRDDHSKNFSFLMGENGQWKFAPAYDLTYSNSSYGMHSTTVAGESKNPNEMHLLKLADEFGIKKPMLILDQVKYAIAEFGQLASIAEISRDSQQMISRNLTT